MKVYITSDSSCDLTREQLEKNNIQTIPLCVTLGDNDYRDGINISPEDIFKYVKENKKLPKTSAIGVEEYKEFFKKVLGKEKDSCILHISMSSGISSSFNNSKAASLEFGGKVISIDGKSLSSGTGLLVLYASELAKEGLSLDEIAKRVEARVPFVQASFIIQEVEFLYRGGRCSALALLGANMLKIKPHIQVKEGVMINKSKPRGKMVAVLKQYIDDTLKEFDNPDKTRCFITHSSLERESVDEIVAYVKTKNIFSEVCESIASSTISSHCGKGTLGILYINDGGNK